MKIEDCKQGLRVKYVGRYYDHYNRNCKPSVILMVLPGAPNFPVLIQHPEKKRPVVCQPEELEPLEAE